MVAILENPAVRARTHAISVAEYHAWIEAGIAPEKVELLRGALVEQMPKSPLHTSIVLRLFRWFTLRLPGGYSVRPEQPLTLADSEPEPDIAIVSGADDDYVQKHPRTACLVIEVSISTEEVDRLKLALYAEAGIPEAWLVLPVSRMVERHTSPGDGAYQTIERAAFPATLDSTVFSGIPIPPSDLFPG